MPTPPVNHHRTDICKPFRRIAGQQTRAPPLQTKKKPVVCMTTG
jgi:hypothetical protein